MEELDIHAYIIDGCGDGAYKLVKKNNKPVWKYIGLTSSCYYVMEDAVQKYNCQFVLNKKLDSNDGSYRVYHEDDLSNRNLIEPSS